MIYSNIIESTETSVYIGERSKTHALNNSEAILKMFFFDVNDVVLFICCSAFSFFRSYDDSVAETKP